MSKTVIYVDLDGTGQWLVFKSPYSADFVADFKTKIPSRQRRWEGEKKVWCVARAAWAEASPLFHKHFADVEFETGPAAEAAHVELMIAELKSPSLDDYTKLGVRSDAPACVVHAAYLAIEIVWASTRAVRVAEMGIYPLKETREAYHRICVHRGIPAQPPSSLKAALAEYGVAQSDSGVTDDADDPPTIDNPPIPEEDCCVGGEWE